MGKLTDQSLRELQVAIIKNIIAGDPTIIGDLLRYDDDYTFEDNPRNIPSVGWILSNTGVTIPDYVTDNTSLNYRSPGDYTLTVTIPVGAVIVGISIVYADSSREWLAGGQTELITGFTNNSPQTIRVKFQ